MNERDAIKAAQALFGSLGFAGRSGRANNFDRPFVTDGTRRHWYGDTFEEALAAAEKDAHPSLAHKVARKAFAVRNNISVICIAEYELVAIIQEALDN